MKLAVVAAVGSYTPADLEYKKRSLRTVLRPDTQLDMFVADSGVPYVESSLELYLSEVAVAQKVVEVAGMGYDAVVGTAFLDNGLDAARELVQIPVVGPAKVTMYMAATLAHKFGVITAAGDLMDKKNKRYFRPATPAACLRWRPGHRSRSGLECVSRVLRERGPGNGRGWQAGEGGCTQDGPGAARTAPRGRHQGAGA